MSVLYIMPMSMQKIRFVRLTVWSPIGNIQTDRFYFMDEEDEEDEEEVRGQTYVYCYAPYRDIPYL